MKTKKTHPLLWTSHRDGRVTIHEAAGGSTDGESADLHYRISETKDQYGPVFHEDSSPELKVGKGWRVWRTLKGAKNAMQQYHEGAFA